MDLFLDQRRGFAVALARARDPLELHRAAPDDRDRVTVPRLPELAPVDGRGDDRHLFLQGDHSRTGHGFTGNARFLPSPFDEEAEREPVPDDLPHHAHRFAVRLATPHGARAKGPDQLAEAEVAVDLALREEVDRARAARAESRRIEPGEVVHREHAPALDGYALLAIATERRGELRQRLDRPTADGPDCIDPVHAGRRSRTSFSIRSTTSATSRSLVSISSASSAGCIRTASLSSRARRSVASASAPMSGRSARRRCSRTPRSAWR